MLKEMLEQLARYQDRDQVFGGDLEFELGMGCRMDEMNEQAQTRVRDLYALGLVTSTPEQTNEGLVTIHAEKARKILEIINS